MVDENSEVNCCLTNDNIDNVLDGGVIFFRFNGKQFKREQLYVGLACLERTDVIAQDLKEELDSYRKHYSTLFFTLPRSQLEWIYTKRNILVIHLAGHRKQYPKEFWVLMQQTFDEFENTDPNDIKSLQRFTLQDVQADTHINWIF